MPQKKILTPLKTRLPRWWIAGILGFSFLGFLDSVYLTAKHYLDFQVTCSLVHGCEEVLGSSFATVFDIPIALAGAAYYLCVLLAAVAFIDCKSFIFLKVIIVLPTIGFFFTIWLLVIQAFIVQAFCLYCLLSAAATTGLFTLGMYHIFYGYRARTQ